MSTDRNQGGSIRTRSEHRRFARATGTAALALTCATVTASCGLGGEPDPAPVSDSDAPNVVVILADDLGWGDLSTGRTNGGHPDELNQTPAIDALADDGVVFDNAYAALTCAPSRAALLTGLSAPRPDNRIYSVTSLDRVGQDPPLLEGAPQGQADGSVIIPRRATTIAEALQGVGYATAFAGKFQITEDESAIVEDHGFDENFGGTSSGAADSYLAEGGEFDNKVSPTLDEFAEDYTAEYVETQVAPYSTGIPDRYLDNLVGTDKHITDAITDSALDFMDRHAGQPFLFWMSHVAVHDPINGKQPRPDLRKKYRRGVEGVDRQDSAYAGLVEGLDQSVARTVDYLETTDDPRNPGRPLSENTIVVVTSDNGGRTDLGASNGPLRGQKGLLLEGGIRVPWVAWSANPELVDGGVVNPSVVDATDMYATLADYGGAEPRPEAPLDGTSLRGALTADERFDRTFVAHFPGYLLGDTRDQRPQTVLRDGRWKLTYSYESQRFRLHDLDADPGERRDLAARRPGKVRELSRSMLDWLEEYRPPLATVREGRGPVRLTVQGPTYADKKVRASSGRRTITVRAGEEMPFVLRPRS